MSEWNWWKKAEVTETPRITHRDCSECGVSVNVGSLQVVDGGRYIGALYYCRAHRKPYDEIVSYPFGGFERTYYSRIQVSEDGVPVGYVKAKRV